MPSSAGSPHPRRARSLQRQSTVCEESAPLSHQPDTHSSDCDESPRGRKSTVSMRSASGSIRIKRRLSRLGRSVSQSGAASQPYWRQLSLSRTVMHKLQFARGIGQREMLRANTLPSITRAKVGWLARLRIYEENARFVLTGFLLLCYLVIGAILFNHLERDNELAERRMYHDRKDQLRESICSRSLDPQCRKHFDEALELQSDATSSGLTSGKDRFDLLGSFFFSGTVISTIGFGTATPRTFVGKFATVIYGVIGCTCCVLFFNLFLERLITAFSYLLRWLHERKVNRRMLIASQNKPIKLLVNNEDYAESASSCGAMDQWRPSVYKVFACLFALSFALITCSAGVYSYAEAWSYIDALYFCFISFGTIGFGDLVSNQKDAHINSDLYRALNFFMLTAGACCFYCLFNVSSIVVRQFVNWMIKKIDVKVEDGWGCCQRKPKRYMGLGLRPPRGYDINSERSSIDVQDGLLSLKEFLANQQSSVLLLQKQLINSALKNREQEEKISATKVGPMGILTQTFGDELA